MYDTEKIPLQQNLCRLAFNYKEREKKKQRWVRQLQERMYMMGDMRAAER
jgi:hypothetical protein